MLSFVLGAIGIAQLFGGGWPEILCSIVTGSAVALLWAFVVTVPGFSKLLEIASAFVSAVIANLLGTYLYHGQLNIFLVTLAGVIILLPGLTLTISIAEIASRHLISGTARLTSALVCALLITGGMVIGFQASEKFFTVTPNDTYAPTPLSDWYFILTAIIVTFAFALALRVDIRQYWVIFIACSWGIFAGTILTEWSGFEGGVFMGSFIICSFGNIYTWYSRNGIASVPIWTGVLILVPGSLSVKGFFNLGNGSSDLGLNQLFTTFFTTILISIGLFTANVVFRPHKAL